MHNPVGYERSILALVLGESDDGERGQGHDNSDGVCSLCNAKQAFKDARGDYGTKTTEDTRSHLKRFLQLGVNDMDDELDAIERRLASAQ